MPTAIAGTVTDISSSVTYEQEIQKELNICIVFFYASFHESSKPNCQLDVVFRQLAALHPRIRFFKADAEVLSDIANGYVITVVPTFCILQGGRLVEKLEGANVSDLAKRVEFYHKNSHDKNTSDVTKHDPEVDEALKHRLTKLINASSVMLFMKGSPAEPKCGFSRQIVKLLDEEGIIYGTFDILQDEKVRQGLKKVYNWPTYPQLYVNGALIGGIDIINEMKEEGPLVDQLGLDNKEDSPSFQKSLRALVNSAKVLLFIKGTPQEPKCGFSRNVVQLLRDHGVPFSSFDILSDEQVRQGLKIFSDWPTYPQLYVDGKLVGGLDILNEMAEDGNLCEQLGVAKRDKREGKYKELINRSPVMIFIKGTPQAPQCGFSQQLIEILNAENFQYESFDILSDDAVRQGLKAYSNWPTYPQVYIHGKLIGGLDIIQQMQEDGDLASLRP